MTKRILITGVSGFIGQYVLREKPAGVQIVGAIRNAERWISSPFYETIPLISLDLAEHVAAQLKYQHFDVVIHAAAMAGLGACQADAQTAERVNALATAELARWCAVHNCRMIYLSTDIVFAGDRAPYSEKDTPRPINVYGQSKWHGEQAVQAELRDYVIARIALSLGRGLGLSRNFLDWILERLKNGRSIPLFSDEIRTPTAVFALSRRIWQIALSSATGIFHLSGNQRMDRLSLGRLICRKTGINEQLLEPISIKDITGYPRPMDVSLKSTRRLNGRSLQLQGIASYMDALLKKN